ncbi:class 1 isoprenoid biosynthesis enzyme [Paenibacillus sp. sptzw28]|uniref:class 1 isoprenoid biosynthesis enzyme n=1 Tax=Paenibacillus sp. sptzw28 TaxID=715179 RepID=UPI001C6E3331|nr:class 1 isoprenoid biosynthesis enzyme [Paenibacillus sp. sptzw28]QYR20875.1 class 1 isoprenoid biosynthesis enzyme [Paenibacillus sp. sptzw28]
MINWKTSFNDELAIVFSEAMTIVSAYPAPLGTQGLAYIDKFNPLLPGGTKNYICYLLPYWLKDITAVDDRMCRKLSLANVFIMLYFFIQDDLMDSPQTDWKEQLALGNLFYLAFLDIYQAEFPAGSPFWDYFRTYIIDWASAVATEGRNAGILEPDLLELAKKAAPVKLASTGALLHTGRDILVPAVSDYIDQVLITLQMVDDWADWEEDLVHGSGNSLLAFIRSELNLPADSPLSPAQVTDSIRLQGGLRRFADEAETRYKRLQSTLPGASCLSAFHHSLSQELVQAADRYERRKQSLLRGGFVNWLSESINE